MAATAQAFGTKLVLQLPANPVRISTPEEILREILANLLDNAVRYGAGGTVTAGIEILGRHAVIHIDDEGAGIPPDQREIVFDRFFRLPATQHLGGSGLGLSIVRALADRLDARIELRDNPAGRGLRASVFLEMYGC